MTTYGVPITRARVWTFFTNDCFYYNDMEEHRRLPDPERKVVYLALGWDRVDRACIDPHDRDHVWFFRGDEVVDYNVSRRDASAPCKIKDHPIFGVLPAALHGGGFYLVFDPREFGNVADAQALALEVVDGRGPKGSSPVLLKESLRGSVDVCVADPTRAVLLGGVLRLTPGKALDLEHEFIFKKRGTYDVRALVRGGGVQVEFAANADGPYAQTLKLTQESDSTATVTVRFTLAKATDDLATVELLVNSGAALVCKYEVIRAPTATGPVPLVYVFHQSTAYLLWLLRHPLVFCRGFPQDAGASGKGLLWS